MNNVLKDKQVGFISLGCDKNRVDTEKFMGVLSEAGCVITNALDCAQIVVVNTCAFLQSARKEAIETILEVASYKSQSLEKLVVTGCLPEKFIDELYEALPEVDVFGGYRDYNVLVQEIASSYEKGRVNAVGKGKAETETQGRIVTTPLHYAYLKIADGCNNHCTYCLIPKIRGKYRSFPKEDLLKEAQGLGDVAELILVAQDVTRYGQDLADGEGLVDLIQSLSMLENVQSIRLLYCYPDQISNELIAEIASNPKVLKYIDIPLQHASAPVLKRMNRPGNASEYLALFEKLRKAAPDIAIRTTFIAGFPGETEEDVETLIAFLQKAKLHNVGFFAYSKEPDTAAARLPNQIPAKEKRTRVKRLFAEQKKIADELYSSYVGKTINVLVDGIDYEKGKFVGRASFQAPDIDGVVYFSAEYAEQGTWIPVRIKRYKNYDLYGVAED